MISLEAALKICQSSVRLLGAEDVPLGESFGRVLATDIKADLDMPPFDKSAMDGFAARRQDLGRPLTVIETIPAGTFPEKKVGPGECSRIMTGAPVPEGADCVIMVEHISEAADGTIVFSGRGSADNICKKGEDLKTGQPVLAAGTLIGPVETGLLASTGSDRVTVSRRPRVGVISTGDELVPPAETPQPGAIRDSNSWQLTAQVLRAGAVPVHYGICPDDPDALNDRLAAAVSECDVVLLSGGVSMGDYDHVPDVLRRQNFEIKFDRVGVKPGKPTTFAVSGEKTCFGLPGNPVSVYVCFEVFVRPFLQQLMGGEYRPVRFKLPLGSDYSRKKTDRFFYRPVEVRDEEVQPSSYHGPAHLASAGGLSAFMEIPEGVSGYNKGDQVYVRFF